MFTIRHVDGAAECPVDNLYEAFRVTHFDPSVKREGVVGHVRVTPTNPGVLGALELRDEEGAVIAALWGGRAYVMNRFGKTVAAYDLAPWPEGGDPTAPN